MTDVPRTKAAMFAALERTLPARARGPWMTDKFVDELVAEYGRLISEDEEDSRRLERLRGVGLTVTTWKAETR